MLLFATTRSIIMSVKVPVVGVGERLQPARGGTAQR